MTRKVSYAASFAVSVAIHAALAAIAILSLSPSGRPADHPSRFHPASKSFWITLSANESTQPEPQPDSPQVKPPSPRNLRNAKLASSPASNPPEKRLQTAVERSAASQSSTTPADSAGIDSRKAASGQVSEIVAGRTGVEVANRRAPEGPRAESREAYTSGRADPSDRRSSRSIEIGDAGLTSDAAQSPDRSSPARLRSSLAPVYPLLARRRGWEGLVLIRVELDQSGQVTQAEAILSSGHKALDSAALSAVEKARFAPATRDGRRIPSSVVVPVRFALTDGSG